jgi:hypothetical protein
MENTTTPTANHGGAAFSLDRQDRDADWQRSKKAGLGQRSYRL